MSTRLFIIVFVLFGARTLFAQDTVVDPRDLPEVRVQLEGGQHVNGLLVEQNEKHVVIRIGGAPRSLPADKVTRITVFPPVLDRYQQMRREIGPDDFASLVQLALWLEQREQYGLAIEELERALKLEPLDRRAADLKKTIEARKVLADKILERQAAGVQPREQGVSKPDGPSDEGMPRLTADDINLIRVFEIDLADPPKLSIERESIDEIINQYGDDIRFPSTPEDQKALYSAPVADILALLFKMQAREFYTAVRVHDDPPAMKQFKDRVHRALIINSCATAECHATPGAGRLRLLRDKRFSDQTVYTNFLILERFKLQDGTPLINYEEPGSSPLLQMALDRDVSTKAHPPVPGPGGRGDLWRPVMRSTADRRYEDTVRWIKMMYRPRPAYPIELTTPEPAKAADLGPPR